MKNPYLFQAIEVTQPVGTFYFCKIPASIILPMVRVERRGISEEEQRNVQRILDVPRTKEIARYANEPDATFPTSVTLSADSEFVHIIEDINKILYLVIGKEGFSEPIREDKKNDRPHPFRTKDDQLEISQDGRVRRFQALPEQTSVALIIDGQHRIEGLKEATRVYDNSMLAEFDMPLVFMFDLTPEVMARIFVTINSNQKKVDPSLISDLFGLSSRRSPLRTCHLIAKNLNAQTGGPFKDGLKMLGRRPKVSSNNKESKITDFLTQGSFCKYLCKLISNQPEEDERRLLRNEELKLDPNAPLRPYFINNDDKTILDVVKNYFTAVSKSYKNAWELKPAQYLMRKTVGFAALVKFLNKILPKLLESGLATPVLFEKIMNVVKKEFPENEWGVGKFSSSEADAGRVANRMWLIIEPHMKDLIADEKLRLEKLENRLIKGE